MNKRGTNTFQKKNTLKVKDDDKIITSLFTRTSTGLVFKKRRKPRHLHQKFHTVTIRSVLLAVLLL